MSSQSKFFDLTDLKSVVRNRLDLSRFSTWNRLGKNKPKNYGKSTFLQNNNIICFHGVFLEIEDIILPLNISLQINTVTVGRFMKYFYTTVHVVSIFFTPTPFRNCNFQCIMDGIGFVKNWSKFVDFSLIAFKFAIAYFVSKILKKFNRISLLFGQILFILLKSSNFGL